jgi:hypothetical protein
MKKLRKNVDLDIHTVAVLQIEATLNGFGTLKPYLEKLLIDRASKAQKERPKIYAGLSNKNGTKATLRKGSKRIARS